MSLLLPLLLTGCARMVPGQVADGVARLAIRHVGAGMVLVNDDDVCGFASPDVAAHPVVDGAIGEVGTATWTVTGCTLDLGPSPVVIDEDRNGDTTSASGAVTVTVRKIVTGQVTGDPDTPVVPLSRDAARFVVDRAAFRDFSVSKSSSDNALRLYDGELRGGFSPLLAADAEVGACSVSTPNATFTDITLGPARAEVTSGKRQFDVDIADLRLDATNGVVGDEVNAVRGEVTVWHHTEAIDRAGERDGLDPDYDPDRFFDSYACDDALARPVTYACDPEPALVENVARLVVKDLGLVIKTVDLDETCGFGNFDAAIADLLNLGTAIDLLLGTPQTVVLEADACRLGGDLFPIYSDCVGTDYFLDGTVAVTGTKTVTGKLALDADPLRPQDRQSALVVIDRADVSELTPYELQPDGTVAPSLTLHGGVIGGTYHPVTGEAADAPGDYFIVIPVGEFEHVRLFDADVTLNNGAMGFPMHLDDSDLYAFTGAYLDDANWLYGTITVDGRVWEIGAGSAPVALDPDYDQAAFDLSYECIDNLAGVVPVN
ncbi:MAG: hypothetical protein R3F59_32365 [Myxococcota bacterium]